ncbi:DUF4386 domain-containing protein [Silvibacterium sp.]|uniref:DUF4386 domain-containing protein n=1 Tax=Silvibacterium sp. TaxID=1964179 RepID=UPI0039E50A2F
MPTRANPGRRAGLLYLLGSLPGFFGLLYVPARLFVHGDAAATAHNLVLHETLFRLGVAADLLGQTLFLFVALALYRLLRDVSRSAALHMLVLLSVSIPIAYFGEIFALAALALARGEGSLATFDEPHRIALMTFFLHLRGSAFDVAGIFWGLWLFPLGWLVYRSGFIPRLLGVLLMIGCFAYLINAAMSLLAPEHANTVALWLNPVELVEMVFMLWLIIMGANPEDRV